MVVIDENSPIMHIWGIWACLVHPDRPLDAKTSKSYVMVAELEFVFSTAENRATFPFRRCQWQIANCGSGKVMVDQIKSHYGRERNTNFGGLFVASWGGGRTKSADLS